MKKGEILDVSVEAMAFEGKGIARHEGVVVFIAKGLPGDILRVRITKVKSSFCEAEISEILVKSKHRQTPPCTHVAMCGGCKWQECEYSEQLFWKEKHVVDAFERIAKVPFKQLFPILGSQQVFHYRNKMEFSFSNRRWLSNEEIASGVEFDRTQFALGLHVPGRFDAVIDVDECFIQKSVANTILSAVRAQGVRLSLTGYNERTREGFLRNLLIRTSRATNEVMVILVTTEVTDQKHQDMLYWLSQDLPTIIPDVTSIIHAVNATQSPVVSATPTVLFGKAYITEKEYGIDFQISPFSFFQTNSYQLRTFLDETFRAADVTKNSTVWDLYCGTGSISLPLATTVDQVIGVELVQSSIDDANANAQRNAITNVVFTCADLHKAATIDYLRTLPTPDVIIVDPPRAGIHEQTLRHILDVESPTIAYVSCNPSTQARDCAILSEKYDIEYLQPIDMFPHTYHIENIARLRLRQ